MKIVSFIFHFSTNLTRDQGPYVVFESV